jgi:hypothetical protein
MRYLISDLRQKLIEYTYSRWSSSHRELSDGYTILLPTPSDLPVFFSLALAIIQKQDLTGLREILVIPDWPSQPFEEFCADIGRKSGDLPIRLVSLKLRDQLAWAVTKGITTRHFTQLVRGIDETHTEHAIIHDSDLFLPPSDFLRTQCEACRDRGLAVLGVEPRREMVFDGHSTFVATWEMTFSVRWAKSFPPFMHKGQFSVVGGRRQDFDTTLLPQYLTDEKLIGWTPRHGDFFHFQYVIATYRDFVSGKPLFPTYGLRLFLIRTLIDVFDVSGWHYSHVPEHSEFLEGRFGLSDLRSQPDGPRRVREFRDTLRGIIHAKIFSEQQNTLLESRLSALLESLKIDPGQI